MKMWSETELISSILCQDEKISTNLVYVLQTRINSSRVNKPAHSGRLKSGELFIHQPMLIVANKKLFCVFRCAGRHIFFHFYRAWLAVTITLFSLCASCKFKYLNVTSQPAKYI